VYPSLADAKNVKNKIATSQLALPEDICNDVYKTAGFEQSVTNLARTSLKSDTVFSDGAELETPTVTGSVTQGYVVTLPVRVA